MSRTRSKALGLLGVTAAATLTALAGPAAAGINGVTVVGLTPGQQCGVSAGCTIQVETDGFGKLSEVEVSVNGVFVGKALPNWNGVASIEWHPTTTGMHTISARHSGSLSSITYSVGNGGVSLCGLLPSGSGDSGSGGTGSNGSGSALSGSGDSGSTTGSVGSGSGVSGSGC
ncbi:hypothetical protein ACWDOP_08795 [Nocardia sp. NPDC003693]